MFSWPSLLIGSVPLSSQSLTGMFAGVILFSAQLLPVNASKTQPWHDIISYAENVEFTLPWYKEPLLIKQQSEAIWNRLLLLLLALELWQLKSFSAVSNSCTRSQSVYHLATFITNSFLVILCINLKLQQYCCLFLWTQRILGLHLIINNSDVQLPRHILTPRPNTM